MLAFSPSEPLAGIALAAGLAWASGLRLYLTLFILGWLAHGSQLTLAPALTGLREPWVLWLLGSLAALELLTDKIPGFDSCWDGWQTPLRLSAGALLAGLTLGSAQPLLGLAAGLLGLLIAAVTHLAKSGGRLAINLSPEPVSNWLASLSEDGIVLGGLWAMFAKPGLFLGLLLLFLILAALAVRVFWDLLHQAVRRWWNALSPLR